MKNIPDSGSGMLKSLSAKSLGQLKQLKEDD